MRLQHCLLVATLSVSACAGAQPQAAAGGGAQPTPHAHAKPALPGHDHGGGMKGGRMMAGGMMAGGMMAMKDKCPMDVPGTTAQAEDVDGGAALTFKTTTGDTAELRKRVAQMAEKHNKMAGGGMHGGGMHGGMMLPPSEARSEDVEGGARLVFTPQKPETLSELRDKVRKHAADMGAHKCPMMQHDKAANAAATGTMGRASAALAR